ncbi:hypothetical protein GGX14DRAFT_643084 [Mycena pura]|uniref:Uncharacterized protein n=1 Tax=Mycena pura TaxID=153505 RepID=A0AAD6YQI9_9AGAR|nr:hypothetical protein GGX14DRAFT_643084 [Mycena pura]
MVTTRTKTYASVAQTTRTSQRTLLQEVADVGVSFNERNEPDVVAAEGDAEPEAGRVPAATQHALRVANSPRIRDLSWYSASGKVNCEESVRDLPPSGGSNSPDQSGDSGALSLRSESFGPILRNSVDQRSTEGEFIVPRHTVKRTLEWSARSRLGNKYQFFPSWFDLSQDVDQLGPIPREWLEKDDKDVQAASGDTLEHVNNQGAGAGVQVESMAIIVEVPEDSRADDAKQPNKGKGVSAGERSAGFAAYLDKMQRDGAAKSSSSNKPEKKEKAGMNKTTFMRPGSQPEFRLEFELEREAKLEFV